MTKWLNDQGADMFLAVDTVFEQCSIAVVTEDLTVLSLDTHFGKRDQTQQILPMIDVALKQAGVSLKDMTALLFNRGPGAFSGIRINTAVVQALSVAHDLPCVGVSSLQALAQMGLDNHELSHVYAALDARMKQVYFGEFVNQSGIMMDVDLLAGGSNVQESLNQAQSAIHATQFNRQNETNFSERLVDYGAQTEKAIAIVGDGAGLLTAQPQQQLVTENIRPNALCLAKLGVDQYARIGGVPAAQALPVYLRNNAWKTLKEQGKS